MNREEVKKELNNRLTADSQSHYFGDDIDDIIDELFDHIEALEQTKKAHEDERKNMIDTHAKNINRLQAKLSKYEDKKVAEFSDDTPYGLDKKFQKEVNSLSPKPHRVIILGK